MSRTKLEIGDAWMTKESTYFDSVKPLDSATLRKLFPNISPDCLAENVPAASTLPEPQAPAQAPLRRKKQPPFNEEDIRFEDTGKNAPLESGVGIGPLAEASAKEKSAARFLVRVTSVRKRLADEDGLCEKYHVDCCRYSGCLPNDDPGTCKIETSQRKAAKGEKEHTQVEIFEI